MEWFCKTRPIFPYDYWKLFRKDFDKIWLDDNNELLKKAKRISTKYKRKCSSCKYIDICNGGSRSRAYAISGDLWDEDPSCYLTLEEIKGKNVKKKSFKSNSS